MEFWYQTNRTKPARAYVRRETVRSYVDMIVFFDVERKSTGFHFHNGSQSWQIDQMNIKQNKQSDQTISYIRSQTVKTPTKI